MTTTPPGKDRVFYLDTTPTTTEDKRVPKGFGLRVSTRGPKVARSFVVVYHRHGRKVWYRLGSTESTTLADARALARDVRLRVDRGEDPARERTDSRTAGALATLVESYVTHGEGTRSDATTSNYSRQQRALAKTTLGKLPARAVTRADVRKWLEELAEDSPVSANRYLALLRATCRWAVGRDLLPADPTAGVERPGAEKPQRTRLDDDAVRGLWVALDAQDDAKKRMLPVQVAAAVRVSLLLGGRKTETLRMRWEHVTLDGPAPAWEIPGEDRKGGRALVVPLAPEVVSILRELKKTTGERDYVFSGRRGGPLSSNPNRWAATVREVGGSDFSLHTLRRTFARGIARLGFSSELVSRLLGHKLAAGVLAVTEGYSEFDFLPERRKALEAWARHVLTVISGDARKGAEVVSIEAGRRA